MHRATPLNSSFRGYTAGGTRSAVDSIDDSKLMQEHSGNFMSGESRQGIEAPQNYGFSSVVMGATKDALGKITDSAEAVISFMGGNRSFPVAGVMDDRRHRLKGLDPGDSAMFRTATDYLQMHFSKDGGFWTAALDKTVRMALIDKNSGQQQQGGGGSGSSGASAALLDSGGGGAGSGSGAGGSGAAGQQQQKGQTAVKDDNQKSKRFVHVTKDEAAISGTNVRGYLDDGKAYYEVNSDKKFYCGAKKGDGQFALVVTLKGPAKNVMGKIG